VKAQPDSLEYRALLARMFVKMGKPQQASETLKALIDRQPDRPQPWLALLSTQLSQKDRPGALATIDRLKKTYKGKRPDLLVARCYWTLGDTKSAGQILDDSMAKNPADLESIRAACLLSEVSGSSDQTEALLRRALKLDPNATWARQKLAIFLVNRPGPSRWAEAWSLVSTPSSGQADTPESRLNRWIVLEKSPETARRAEARDGLQTLVDDLPATNPVAFQARMRLARLLLVSKDPAGAARAIAPISADPAVNEPAILALAIEALTLSGRIEEARQRLDRLIKVEPNAPSTIGCRAMVLKTEGDLEGAASTIEEAATVSEKANDGDRQNLIFLDQLIQLKLDEAADRLGRKIAGRWAKFAWAWAGFLADRGRFDEALDAAKIAADAGSNLEATRLIVAMSSGGRLNPSQIDRGRTLLVSIAMKEPKNSELISLTAWLLRQQGRYEDEANLYRSVLAVDPSNLQARNNLAWVLSDNLNRPAEGLVEVDRVIKQSGLSPQNGDTRGVILLKLGRFDEAIIELERATKSAPNAIHYLHLSRAMAAKGRAEDAKALLNEAKKVLKNPKELEPADLAEVVASAAH
jgi:tetratricopeptide (TPR) repeat protein